MIGTSAIMSPSTPRTITSKHSKKRVQPQPQQQQQQQYSSTLNNNTNDNINRNQSDRTTMVSSSKSSNSATSGSRTNKKSNNITTATSGNGNDKRNRIHPSQNNKSTTTTTTTIRLQVEWNTRSPVVCSFPNGLPASLQDTADSVLQTETNDERNSIDEQRSLIATQPKFRLLQQESDHNSTNAASTKITKLIGKDENCFYQALMTKPAITGNSTLSGSRTKWNGSRTRLCVALYDKQTNHLILHPTDTCWTVTQTVLGYQSNSTLLSNTNTVAAAATQMELVAEFGSSKKKRALQSKQANRVVNASQVIGVAGTMARIVQSSLQQQTTGTTTPNTSNAPEDAVEAATEEWRRNFLPRQFNVDATEPFQVYPPHHMAGSEAWQMICRIVDSAEQKDASNVVGALRENWQRTYPKTPEWGQSILRLADRIEKKEHQGSRPKHLQQQEQYRCLQLLYDWAQLYHIWRKQRRIKNPTRRVAGVPVPMAISFLQNFATQAAMGSQDGFCMSKANHDRCQLHLLLLFCMAEDAKQCRSDFITDFSRDVLQLDIAQAIHLLKQAGCTVSKSSSSNWTAKIATPLIFPQATAKKRARRSI